MNKKYFGIIILFFLYRTVLGTPFTDTALLFQLVTTTSSQLVELESLVRDTMKLTNDFQEYAEAVDKFNTTVQDHYYRAQRVYYLAEDFQSLKEVKIKDLGNFNAALRRLYYQIKDFDQLMVEYHLKELKDESIIKQTEQNAARIQNNDDTMAKILMDKAEGAKGTENVMQTNAEINSVINKNIVDLKKQNNLMINMQAEQKKTKDSEKKDEAMEQAKKMKFYGINQRVLENTEVVSELKRTSRGQQ